MWHEINDRFNNGGGVYILKCLRSADSSAPIPIDRLLGSDNDGTSHIGKANRFTDRVAELKKCSGIVTLATTNAHVYHQVFVPLK